jgi:hypothetical protein
VPAEFAAESGESTALPLAAMLHALCSKSGSSVGASDFSNWTGTSLS